MSILTAEKKYGYTDGQHIGWYGTQFAVFARVVNGVAYCVGKELAPTAPDLNKVYKLGRDWLAAFFGQVTGNGAGDAALFVDGPHYTLETADSSEFVTVLPLPSGSTKVVTRPTLTTQPTVPNWPTPVSVTVPPIDPGPTSYPSENLTVPVNGIPLFAKRADGFAIYDYPLVHLIGEDFRYHSSKEFSSVVSLGIKITANYEGGPDVENVRVRTNTGYEGIVPLYAQDFSWYAGSTPIMPAPSYLSPAPVTPVAAANGVMDWLKKYWYIPAGGFILLMVILGAFSGESD